MVPVGAGGGTCGKGDVSSCPGVTKSSSWHSQTQGLFGSAISSFAWPSVCPPLPETLTQLVSFSASLWSVTGSQKVKGLFATR